MESEVVSLLPLSTYLHAIAVRLCKLFSHQILSLSLTHSLCHTDWNQNVDFRHHCYDQV